MNAIEKLIRSALDGKPAWHEALPEDFGADASRGSLLRECLMMMLSRHPRPQIQIVGSPVALSKFALGGAFSTASACSASRSAGARPCRPAPSG